jgi:DNA-binding MarR family transcriptional regulator
MTCQTHVWKTSLLAMKKRPTPKLAKVTLGSSTVGDHVETLLREWGATRPELDVTPIGVVYRLTRIAAAWNAEIDRVFAEAEITSTDFAILANLVRVGVPNQLTQRRLATVLRLTAGTVSLRIDKLVARGFVERLAEPNDSRSTLVLLTEFGRAAFDAIAPVHLANEARLPSALSDVEQEVFAGLLKRLLIEIEQPQEHRPDERLGMRLASSAETIRKRAAVGLPPVAGLLVESVVAKGPAAIEGVCVGDVITEANSIPTRSLSCLERAIAASGGGSALQLTVHRLGCRYTFAVEVSRDS